MIVVGKGEVARGECVFPGDDPSAEWLRIRGGEFAGPKEGGLVTYRIAYLKKEKNHVLWTMDARATSPRPDDVEDPNIGLLPEDDRPEIVNNRNVTECMLSIDLGNTRTVVLLIDQLGDSSGRVNVYKMPMRWEHDAQKVIDGVFESVISLNVPDCEAGLPGEDGCRRSFLKLGRFATSTNNEFVSLQERSVMGRYTLSSPKRYFWDRDKSKWEWQASRIDVASGSDRAGVLRGRFAEDLAWSGDRCESGRLPPADMLSAMVAEIYEQAIHYVSSSEFIKKTDDANVRRITRIHVTYPSTLLEREKKLYEEQLRRGISVYLSPFVGHPQVKLTSEIDEASSVLSVFAYSSIHKAGSADFWLRTIGRRSTFGHEARVAVIDIGGGTSDLSIANIESESSTAATNPFKASIDLLHRDGANKAGDILIFELLDAFVADRLFKALWKESGIGNNANHREDFLVRYFSKEERKNVIDLTRKFWVCAAIEVAKACDKVANRFRDDAIPEDFNGGTVSIPLDSKMAEKWNRILKPAQSFNATTKLQIPIGKLEVDSFKRVVESVFKATAKTFAKAISCFDVDLLIFSGKTADFKTVRYAFTKLCPLDELTSVICMSDCTVGRWCGSLVNAEGRISDSKVATALGGALYVMKDYSPIGLTFSGLSRQVQCVWGIVMDPDSIAFALPMFPEGNRETSVSLTSGRVLIARKMLYSKTATLSYELRVKPYRLLTHEGGVSSDVVVRLERDDLDQSIRILEANGHFADGLGVTSEDVELRVCSMSQEFAMDKIVEIKKED